MMNFSYKDYEAINADKNQRNYDDYKDITSFEKQHPFFARRARKLRNKHRFHLVNPVGASLGDKIVDGILIGVPLGVLILILYFLFSFIHSNVAGF